MISTVFKGLLVALIQIYRYGLSPAKQIILGQTATCRFTPSCSAYALEAVRRHGPVSGVVLSTRRLCRCHPWGSSGPDPVPDLIQDPS